MKNDNIYMKGDNGRYIPFGVCYQPNYLPDGIWYVRHHDHGWASTAVSYMQGLFKVGDAKELDITELCGMEDLCDYIMSSKEYIDTISNSKGYSINDIIHVCVQKLVDKAKEQKEKANEVDTKL